MPLISTSGAAEIVTLAELKAHANIPAGNTTSDVELDLLRLAAQEAVEGLVGPVVWRSFTETVRHSGGVVVLRHAPVAEVTSFTAAGTAVTGYTLDGPAGLLTGVTASGDLSITYSAGRSTVPPAIKVATLIIGRHLWDTQRGNAPSALPTVDETAPQFGVGYAIPNRAMDLLAPFLLPSGVA